MAKKLDAVHQTLVYFRNLKNRIDWHAVAPFVFFFGIIGLFAIIVMTAPEGCGCKRKSKQQQIERLQEQRAAIDQKLDLLTQ